MEDTQHQVFLDLGLSHGVQAFLFQANNMAGAQKTVQPQSICKLIWEFFIKSLEF